MVSTILSSVLSKSGIASTTESLRSELFDSDMLHARVRENLDRFEHTLYSLVDDLNHVKNLEKTETFRARTSAVWKTNDW